MEKKEINVGDTVQFRAQRIEKGNPVKGVVTTINSEWITVKLLKNIEGMINSWDKGETKSFRLELIKGGIEGITHPTN